ncbi:hypothetical protein EON65_02845 [archaeon]|nr:MAG: hypothetical protein EON65_02845 [archaeon]
MMFINDLNEMVGIWLTALSLLTLLSCTVSSRVEPVQPKEPPPPLTEPAHHCAPEQFKYGQWIRGISACGLSAQYDFGLVESIMVHPPPEHQTFNHFADWCWQPHNCKVRPFSVDEFCHRLAGRRMLVVGDSTQHEFYVGIHMQLHVPYQPPTQWVVDDLINDNSRLGKICDGKGGGRLEYIRNDQISMSDVVPWNLPAFFNGVRVISRDWKVVAPHFDILVLNKGTHYLPDGVSKAQTRETAAFLRQFLAEDPKRHVFFRTTPPGHPHCSNLSRANETLLLSEPTWMPPLTEAEHKLFVDTFNYDKFPHMNEETVRILLEMLPPRQFTVLYVAEMSVLRPDGHRCFMNGQGKEECDWIHHYMPSVVDSWVHVLFNLLPTHGPDGI